MVDFRSERGYETPLDEEFCIGLPALPKRLLSGEGTTFHSYRTEFYNKVFALVEEVKSAVSAADHPFLKST